MRATRRNMLDAKGDDELIPFIIIDRWQDPEVKDLPILRDVVAAKAGKKGLAIYDAWAAQMAFQRPLSVPPGTPKDRIDILRRAFSQTVKDPEFLADAKKARLTINPMSGEEIEEFVKGALSIEPDVKEELQSIIVKRKKKKQT